MCPLYPLVQSVVTMSHPVGDHAPLPVPSSGSAVGAVPRFQLPVALWRGLGNHCLSATMRMEL